MLVYRLENKLGKGPYNGGVIWDQGGPKPSYLSNLYNRHSGAADPHPTPGQDGLGYIDDREFFGFDTAAAVCAWFFREPEDAELLTARGLFVTVWEVPVDFVRYGRKQIVFYRAEAHQVRHMTPIEFLEEVNA